jgi:16S rRNA (guanine966-N2)-methyltransferase
MRVIAGSARSLPLKTIEGTDTRPTQDRIKETLFNMLQSDIPGCKFLDLYSGSGAIGIEALSRGAAKAVLVENSKKAVECIKDNLTFTKLADKADVMEMDVLSAINRLKGKDVFSIVYMDPPYSNDYERDVLAALRNSDIIDEYTIIIVEEKLDADLDYADECGFDI